MEAYNAAELRVFAQVEKVITENARDMIYLLNDDWRTLGVDDAERNKRTRDLVGFVQERFEEVILETAEKVKSIKEEIEKLRVEFEQLTSWLNTSTTSKYRDEKTLMLMKQVLETDLELLRGELKVRTEKIFNLNEWSRKLSQLLGSVKRFLPELPLPSDETVECFEQQLEQQQKEYERRLQTFLEKQLHIKKFLSELEQTPTDSFQHYIVESSIKDFNVTDANMAQLLLVYENLADQLEERKNEILKKREHLESLWERLMEPAAHRANFLSKYTGHSRATEKALISEINRCEEKKRENFQLFLGKLRSEIVDVWDICKYSQLQRDRFTDFNYDNGYNEDVLSNHEDYLENLKIFYQENKNIFEMYETRENLWTKWKELEEKSKEPGRYQNRGGQLLREEKDRKAVSVQLPKIEKELAHLAEEFENRTGKQFTVNGIDVIQAMAQDWQQKNAEKQHKLSARKQKALPKTPMSVPRSAPATNRLLPLMNKDTLTAVKRRLSPRNSPRTPRLGTSRRLHFTANGSGRDINKSLRKGDKTTVPVLAINGLAIKKRKSVGRISQESKSRRRSRKSNSKTPSKRQRVDDSKMEATLNSSTYSEFQDHINSNKKCRSSAVNDRIMRPKIFNIDNKVKIDNHTYLEDLKENVSPNNLKSNFTPSDFCTPLRGKADSAKVNANKSNVNVFATPQRPVTRANKTLQRQNTVLLASPSVYNTRPLRRSNSSHNLREIGYSAQSPKIQLTSKFRLVI